jgi:hypothetical protein
VATPTWPQFPGEDGAPVWEIVGGKTITTEAESGNRYTVALWSGYRKRYTFSYSGLRTYVMAPSPFGSYSEVECVQLLVAGLQGGFGLCYVVDPVDSVSRLCKLEADSVELPKQKGAAWYTAQVPFLTVATIATPTLP